MARWVCSVLYLGKNLDIHYTINNCGCRWKKLAPRPRGQRRIEQRSKIVLLHSVNAAATSTVSSNVAYVGVLKAEEVFPPCLHPQRFQRWLTIIFGTAIQTRKIWFAPRKKRPGEGSYYIWRWKTVIFYMSHIGVIISSLCQTGISEILLEPILDGSFPECSVLLLDMRIFLLKRMFFLRLRW